MIGNKIADKITNASKKSNNNNDDDDDDDVKGTITITGEGVDAGARQGDERDKGLLFKSCAPFPKCINRTNNTDR